MTCPTCKREDVPETCGPHGREKCQCCGMQIIDKREEPPRQIPDNQG